LDSDSKFFDSKKNSLFYDNKTNNQKESDSISRTSSHLSKEKDKENEIAPIFGFLASDSKKESTEVKTKSRLTQNLSFENKEGALYSLENLNLNKADSKTTGLYSPHKISEKEKEKDIFVSQEEQQKITLQTIINQYYTDISENYVGNYEEYVVNNLTIVSYLNKLMQLNGYSVPKLSKEDEEIVAKFDKTKKVLFLDLDETLIHSDINCKYDKTDAIITLPLDDGASSFGIMIRPYVNEFLQYTSETFNVVLFTAGIKSYADSIVDYLDPEKKYFSLRLYRDSCIQFNNFYIKDLSIIPGFTEKDVIILDNCIFSFAVNLRNAILISSYYSDVNDRELLNVTDYLDDKLVNTDDVRDVNEGFFGFETIRNYLYDKLIQEGIITAVEK
jgi:Dullard-like phosphatase family protein